MLQNDGRVVGFPEAPPTLVLYGVDDGKKFSDDLLLCLGLR